MGAGGKKLGMVAFIFNLSTREAEAASSLEFKATLLNRMSSRIVRVM